MTRIFEEKNRIVYPEQKSVGKLQGPCDPFSGPVDLLVALFLGTFVTAKVCLEVLRNNRCVGCKPGDECFVTNTYALSETYARHSLKKNSDTSGTDDVIDGCKILDGAMHRLQTKKKMNFWKLCAAFCSVHMFASYITQFVFNISLNAFFFEIDRPFF